MKTPQEIFEYIANVYESSKTCKELYDKNVNEYICNSLYLNISKQLKKECKKILKLNKPSENNSFKEFTENQYFYSWGDAWWDVQMAKSENALGELLNEKARYLRKLIKKIDKK